MLDLNSKVTLPNKKEFEFFQKNRLSNWKFTDFIQHCQENSRMPVRIDKVSSQYEMCLNNIKQTKQEDDVKKYIEKLLAETNEKVMSIVFSL